MQFFFCCKRKRIVDLKNAARDAEAIESWVHRLYAAGVSVGGFHWGVSVGIYTYSRVRFRVRAMSRVRAASYYHSDDGYVLGGVGSGYGEVLIALQFVVLGRVQLFVVLVDGHHPAADSRH